ncbi:Box C/D snoRNA accumulation [Coemansia sp. RSA 1935]|nr:Box C/D snoRNA accumulation [Coemansia sp. RSA 1935]
MRHIYEALAVAYIEDYTYHTRMEDTEPKTEAILCEQCQQIPAKYKCPGCLVRTCSLACSKTHKSEANCSGQRDKAVFVKRADYDANTMMSDYGFLQDLTRDHALLLRDAHEQGVAQVKQKGRAGQNNTVSHGDGPPNVPLDRSQRNIVSRAKEQRQVMIRYMSPGIKRHQQNKTIWVSAKSRLVWTLEIAIPEITGLPNKWIENGFHDVCQVGNLWTGILSEQSNANEPKADGGDEKGSRKRARTDEVRLQLILDDGNKYLFKSSVPVELLQVLKQKFSKLPVEDLVWLIRIQNLPANKPTFCKIDPLQPLYTQLRYQTVLEFPTVYVYSQEPTTWDGYAVTIQEHCVAENDTEDAAIAANSDKEAAVVECAIAANSDNEAAVVE